MTRLPDHALPRDVDITDVEDRYLRHLVKKASGVARGAGDWSNATFRQRVQATVVAKWLDGYRNRSLEARYDRDGPTEVDRFLSLDPRDRS